MRAGDIDRVTATCALGCGALSRRGDLGGDVCACDCDCDCAGFAVGRRGDNDRECERVCGSEERRTGGERGVGVDTGSDELGFGVEVDCVPGAADVSAVIEVWASKPSRGPFVGMWPLATPLGSKRGLSSTCGSRDVDCARDSRISALEESTAPDGLLGRSRCCDELAVLVAETLRTILGSNVLGGELERTIPARDFSLASLSRSSSAFATASRSCNASEIDESFALLAHGAFNVSSDALAECRPSPYTSCWKTVTRS